jgi:hypothetical protein
VAELKVDVLVCEKQISPLFKSLKLHVGSYAAVFVEVADEVVYVKGTLGYTLLDASDTITGLS